MTIKISIADLSKYKLKSMPDIKCARVLKGAQGGDIVSLSKKSPERKALNKFQGVMSQGLRKLKLRNAPEAYMDEFLSESYIKRAAEVHNDEIAKILDKYGFKPEVKMQHLEDSRNHFITTYNFARNLTKEGGFVLSDEERYALLEAALLHDAGKALIPTEVFNKPGKFTPAEREIMDLHSEFSYILLKDSGINNKTLNAIRNHHHTENTNDTITEILSLCDEASALKENRVYKKGFSDEKTKKILQEDSLTGKLDPKVTETGLNIMSIHPIKKNPQLQ